MSNIDAPKYQKIVDYVKEKIATGEWPPGHKLPSQAKWASDFKTTYGTLRGAYLILKAEGWIGGQQGEGVYVLDRGTDQKSDQKDLAKDPLK